MIDELRIIGLRNWPDDARDEFLAELGRQVPTEVGVKPRAKALHLELPNEWPNLKRENFKRSIVKSLKKAEHDHGITADVESIEHVETESVEFD